MKCKIFIFIIITFLSFHLFGQKVEDVVYLKNGSIIRGRIVEMVPEQYVKIESAGGNVWVFQTSEILKVTKEDAYKPVKPYESKFKGFYTQSYLGFLAGDIMGYYNPMALTLHVSCGYKWDNKLYAGIVSGFEFLYVTSLPLLASARYDFFDKRVTPYISLHTGYALPLDGKTTEEWDYNYTGGYIVNPSVGVRSYFNNNTAIDFGFGYRREELYSKRYDSYYKYEVKRTEIANRIFFSIGFLFK